MMLADPRLVVAEPVEVLQQLHVALDRQGRVLVVIMKRRQKDAAAQVEIAHGVASGAEGSPHVIVGDCARFRQAISGGPCIALRAAQAALRPGRRVTAHLSYRHARPKSSSRRCIMIERRPFEQLGGDNHGWLNTRHHFSFAGYHDPKRLNWGALRVWNDDEIAPDTGFPPHPHADMEIITYVRQGAITHQDSLGNKGRT